MLALIELNDLRGDVARSSTSEEEIFFKVNVSCQSKVNDNWGHRRGISQHNVLRFEISMHHSLGVHLLKSTKKSKHELLDFL